jgi:hypothetical protein
MAGGDAMANQAPSTERDISYRTARRGANRTTLTRTEQKSPGAQSLIELACECMRADCQRTVRVPVDVYARMLDGDQYLLQAGHHAFERYRTIVTVGLMSIEEAA